MRRVLLAALLLALAAHPVAAQGTTPTPITITGPQNVRALVTAPGTIEVGWDAPGPEVARVDVLRRDLGYRVLADPSVLALTDGGLTPGQTYHYQVRFCRPHACAMSGTVSVTLPPPVPTLIPTATSTETPTATPTDTPTMTPTPMPTDTPTPEPTATSTPGPCPGVYAGIVVEHNTLTVTCVKATETPWPDSVEFRGWQVPP